MDRVVVYSWLAFWFAVTAGIGYWTRRQHPTVAGLAPTHPARVRITLSTLGALQCTLLLTLLSVLPILEAFPRFHFLLQDDAIRLGYWLGVGTSQLLCLMSEVAVYVRYRRTRPA